MWQPWVEQAHWRHFSNSICSLHVSVSHLGNLHNISSFIIFTFVMVICDLWCYYHNYFGAPWTIPIKASKRYMLCVFWVLHWSDVFPSLSFSSALPILWDTTILKLGQLITLQWPLSFKQRKSHMSLTLFRNHYTQWGRHVESQDRVKARILTTVSQAVYANKEFLKEVKSATPVNTWIK